MMMDRELNHPSFDPPSLREKMETCLLYDGPLSTVSSDRNVAGDPLLHPNQPDPPSSSALPTTVLSPFPITLSSPLITTPLSPLSNTPPYFPDPPSYADAVSSQAAELQNFDYVKIAVSDPQKESDSNATLVPGTGTFVSYLITTRPRATNSLAPNQEISVRRRFRDIVTLADRISESYRGFVIPPRPDKSVVESQVMQKQEFVEQRRLAMEKYLCKLAEHPVIGKSDELKAFLQAPGKLPLPVTTDMASRVLDGAVRLPKQLLSSREAGSGYLASPQEAVLPAKGGRDLLRMFKELKQAVANDWGGVKTIIVEEDKAFLQRSEKVMELEQHLSTACQQAEALVKVQQDMSETMGELGLAFLKLGKFESEEAVCDSQRARAADFKHLATTAVRTSRAQRESNSLTMKHLDKLHEYYGLMLAIHHAFSDRSSALITLQTLSSDLSSLRSREERLAVAYSNKAKTRKLEELKEAIVVTEDAKRIAFREYERVKENNRSELDRLDKERHEDFLAMIKGFVISQAEYAEKISGIWTQVSVETSRYANGSD